MDHWIGRCGFDMVDVRKPAPVEVGAFLRTIGLVHNQFMDKSDKLRLMILGQVVVMEGQLNLSGQSLHHSLQDAN